jgi:hypothetical protein
MPALRFTEHGILRVNADSEIDDIVTALKEVAVHTGAVPVWIGPRRIIISPKDSQDEIRRKVTAVFMMIP